MSVLIRGMEMPLSCWHSCTLKKVTIMGEVYCPLINKYLKRGEIGVRHPDCPLVEVKEPHGRLGDLDAVMGKVAEMMQEPDYQHEGENWSVGLIMASDAIQEAETIIEPEWSE